AARADETFARAPTAANVENARTSAEATDVDYVIERVPHRLLERLIVACVQRLGVHAIWLVEKREIELVPVIVVLWHPRHVASALADHHRHYEAHDGADGVPVGQNTSKIETAQHVAFDVDIA